MKAFNQWFKEINPDIKYNEEELAKGIQVELEHTPYKAIARIIAKHHLAECPNYYTRLETLETDCKTVSEEDEQEKRRLDPKCWKGYRKAGTKMKGSVHVNKCVKVKDQDEQDIHKPVKPGRLKKRLGKLSCSKVSKAKSGLKNKGTDYAKGLQRYLNYHC